MTSFMPNRDDHPDDTPCRCASCDWAGPIELVSEIRDPAERLTPGVPLPAGECPECGALAYVDRTSPPDTASS